jgi:hypothetical protein
MIGNTSRKIIRLPSVQQGMCHLVVVPWKYTCPPMQQNTRRQCRLYGTQDNFAVCVTELYDIGEILVIKLCVDANSMMALNLKHKTTNQKSDKDKLWLNIREPRIRIDWNHQTRAFRSPIFWLSRGPKKTSRLDSFDAHRLKNNFQLAQQQATCLSSPKKHAL